MVFKNFDAIIIDLTETNNYTRKHTYVRCLGCNRVIQVWYNESCDTAFYLRKHRTRDDEICNKSKTYQVTPEYTNK